ncbi:hypothetical protein [Lacimicrobium alkaliphilum]|uniref:Uncharacterized protein n=1 Tax=Lacimicrobium alkaliphilum TaxID=1526571 RepID=A0ABQ1RCV3_9ALTE|nr:hypothetical protein [Lacimicrobium alkaliphilum]GGD62919.1 hypothetical protein GCM10011357_17750 [Lacimicrobium alkaliphilum]
MVKNTFADWLDVPGLKGKSDVVLQQINTCYLGARQAQKDIAGM